MSVLNQKEIVNLMDRLALSENEQNISWEGVDGEQVGYFDHISKIIPHMVFAELRGDIENLFLSACKNGDYGNPNFEQYLIEARKVRSLLMNNKQFESHLEEKGLAHFW